MADLSEPSLPLPTSSTQTDFSPRRPQLRLHHFFTLTAIAAVIFALEGPMLQQWSVGDGKPPRIMTLVSMSWGVLYSFCVAAGVTAVVYAVAWRRQGIAFFDQPGHWLLFEIGVTGLLWLAVYGIIWRLVQSEDGSHSSPVAYQLLWISVLALTAANFTLNVYIAWKKCREWRWKSVYLLKSLSFVSQFLQSLPLGAISVAAGTLIAIGRDRRQQVVRDTAHWCGVALELFTCALALGFAAISWLCIHHIQ